MINLLPPEHKSAVEKGYKFRLASAYILLLSIVMFIGGVLLLPSYFFASTQENLAAQELSRLQNSSESTEREAINEELLVTKEYLRDLTLREDKQPVFELIDIISNEKNANVDITQLSYIRNDQSGSTISIGGLAATRDALLAFDRALESIEVFEEIILPVQILAEEEDINFTIQVKGNF